MKRLIAALVLCALPASAYNIVQMAKESIAYSELYIDTTVKTHPNLDTSHALRARIEVMDALTIYCGAAAKCSPPKDRIVRSRLTDNLKAALSNLDQEMINLAATLGE